MLLAAGASALGLGGCGLIPRPAVLPMPALRLAGPCAAAGTVGATVTRAPTLVVMLPGAASLPQEFVDEGFVAALAARGIAADVVVADSHLGYFNNRSVIDRLRLDIIGPARQQGYGHIWLVGISLGGFGALIYAAAQGSQPGAAVDGVLALAPYLGRPSLLAEVAQAPSPAAWATGAGAAATQPAAGSEAEARERELWRWLVAPPAGAPPVWLGYGSEDRLGEGHRLLRRVLPAERVLTVPGGHDWPPWRALWQGWLDRGLLGRDCSA